MSPVTGRRDENSMQASFNGLVNKHKWWINDVFIIICLYLITVLSDFYVAISTENLKEEKNDGNGKNKKNWNLEQRDRSIEELKRKILFQLKFRTS